MPLPETISTGELAACLGIARQTIQSHKERGIIAPVARDTWETIKTLQAMCAHYRSIATAGANDLDLSGERARLAKEQADGHAMKNEALRGSLLPRAAVTACVHDAFSRCRSRMLSIPGKMAPVLLTTRTAPEIQEQLLNAVSEALAELSETQVVGAAADAGASGDAGGSDGLVADPRPAAEDDGEPVGGRKSTVVERGKRRAR